MNKYLKLSLLLLPVVLVGLVLPAMLPKTFTVRHMSEIHAPAPVVFALVNDFRNWENWSAWYIWQNMPEPAYGNRGVGRGGFIEWESGQTGKYLQEFTIVKSEPHNQVEIAMDFTDKAFGVSIIEIHANGDTTLLSWSLGIKTEGWKTVFFWLNARKALRKASENLANMAELWHAQNVQIVEQGIISEFPYVSIRRQILWEDLSDAMGDIYAHLIRESGEDSYQITGHAFAMYHSMGEDKVDIECGFPVERVTSGQGITMAGIFPEINCVVTEYTGSYETLEKGHEAVQRWMTDRGYILSGPPMEIFVTSGSDTEDPSAWKTRICYPVEFR